MSQSAITVDTGGSFRRWSDAELVQFYRNVGVMQSAVDSMKRGVHGLRSGIQGATRCFAQMGTCVQGVLSALMNTKNVVTGLKAGMKNLYQYSRTWWKSFAGTLSSLSANATYLKNSLAAMAAPILQALAPAIEFVTDKFVDLFNIVNQFFARLTGASTYVAARRASSGISGVGSSASDAAEEVHELKRQLSDFDDLSVLTAAETGSGSGSGGGGGSGGGSGMAFEQREIESGLAGFVDSLKAAFLAGDWQELGTLIGGKVNELIAGVDWAAAGAKVGYYINGLFSTLYWTLETVNFTNIGASVAEFLNNALAEIDFTTVGATLALLFTSLAETIAGFIDEFDWVQFAEKMADGVNGFMTTLGEKLDAIDWAGLALKMTEGLNAFIARTDWENVGSTLGGRINDLLTILGTAAANFDWTAAGNALATSVNSLFKRIDWEGLGTWLNNTLLGVLDFGIAFFQGFDATGFADNVKLALSKVDWDAISSKLWELFKLALQKLGEIVGTLLFGGTADVGLNLELLKKGWETVTGWLGIDDPLKALISLVKNNWTTIAAFVGTAVKVLATLAKADDNQTPGILFAVATALGFKGTLSKSDANQAPGTVFDVATLLGFKGTLKRSDDDQKPGVVFDVATLLGFKGTLKRADKEQTGSIVFNVAKLLGFKGTLKRADKNQTGGIVFNVAKLLGFKGTLKRADKNQTGGIVFNVAKLLGFKGTLKKADRNQTPGKVFGTALTAYAKLVKASGTSSTVGALFGTALTAYAKLVKSDKKQSSGALFGTAITVTATLSSAISGLSSWAKKVADKVNEELKKLTGNAEGGVISNGGHLRRFARGGVISGGMARYLARVPHYAGGTTRAHGTVFVAGEAGPEIMGHINGRTEILNRSQLAQTMYSAVLSAMSQSISALGTFLSGQLANCTNAIVATVGNLAGVSGIVYHEPVMAAGTVLPYDVAAQIARTGMDLQNTMDANTEDLIQTIISVAGQIVAAVQSQGNREQGTGNRNSLTARQLIDDINRRTQMFGGSPLLD